MKGLRAVFVTIAELAIKLLALFAVSILLLPFALSAQTSDPDLNAPGQSLPSLGRNDFERYGNVVTKDVIENAKQHMPGVSVGVQESVDRIKSEYDAAQGATPLAKVENWSVSSSRWDHFRGSSDSEVQDASSQYTGNAISAFESCQDPYSHTYLLTLMNSIDQETNVEAMIMNEILESMDMVVTYDGYMGAFVGQENVVGYAFRCEINPLFEITGVLCFCQSADVIEYYYPVQRMNLSEQMFQSALMTKDDVNSYVDGIKQVDKVLPSTMRSVISTAQLKTQMNLALAGRDVKIDKSKYGEIRGVSEDAYKAVEAARGRYKHFDHTAPSGKMVYGRVFSEGANMINLFMGDLPHEIIVPTFGTDYPMGYSYSKLFQYSSRWSKQWNAFMKPGGEFSCVRNNVASEKTPRFPLFDRDGSISRKQLNAVDSLTRGEEEDEGRCLKNIGEVHHTMADMRRPSVTDMSWAGLAKAMEVYQKAVSKGGLKIMGVGMGRYSYYDNLDKWHVVSDGDLRRETPQCDILNNLTRPNVAYKDSNVKRIGTGSENTIESFLRLKGAIAHKGHDVDWFEQGSCGGFAFDFGETAYDGEFRLE